VGATAAGRFGRGLASRRVGHCQGLRIRHGRRNRQPRDEHLARHRRRLGQRTGDDTMVMLKSYEHVVDFFSKFQWWKTEPPDELVNNEA
jgi:hypothetical protein